MDGVGDTGVEPPAGGHRDADCCCRRPTGSLHCGAKGA